MRWLLVVGLLAGCYGPRVQAGSPCTTSQQCPLPLTCDLTSMTCEMGSSTGSDAGGHDATVDGPVADAPVEPANDVPGNPTPITGTITITEDITWAQSDASGDGSTSCGNTGRTVFFSITTTFTQTWYFDTFGSTYGTIIRGYGGACQAGMQPAHTKCTSGACGTMQSQAALNIGSGSNCIEVAENAAVTSPPTSATLVLHVEKTGRGDGMSLEDAVAGTGSGSAGDLGSGTVSGNTCTNASAFWTGSCGGAGDEDAYYFTVCPNTTQKLTASTCNPGTTPGYETALYVREVSTDELACDADDDVALCAAGSGAATLSDVEVTGPHVFWLVVDSVGSGSCDPYVLTESLE